MMATSAGPVFVEAAVTPVLVQATAGTVATTLPIMMSVATTSGGGPNSSPEEPVDSGSSSSSSRRPNTSSAADEPPLSSSAADDPPAHLERSRITAGTGAQRVDGRRSGRHIVPDREHIDDFRAERVRQPFGAPPPG